MSKKICMLVTNPVTNDPRVRREASTLVKAGYKVTVIGVGGEEDKQEEWLEGYMILRLPQSRFIGGESLRGAIALWAKRASPIFYRSLRSLRRAVSPGSREDRVADRKQHTARQVGKSSPLSFPRRLEVDALHIVRNTKLNLAMAAVAIEQRADVYHAHDLDTLLAGYLAKRKTGKHLVYDFHELYTEQQDKIWKTVLWRAYYSLLERLLIKQACLKMTVCDSLAEWVGQRYGARGVITIMNVPRSWECQPIQPKHRREKIIIYQGHYFRDRGLEQLIESARYLDHGKILLRGHGHFEDYLRNLVMEKGVQDRVVFAPPVPMTDLVRAAAEADIGAAPFVPVCLNTWFCLPNKLFEYMMAGLAIVGSDLPELRRIILGHNLGVVFKPGDSKDLARAINELITDDARLEVMKRNARQAAREIYNWETEEKKLLEAYDTTAVGEH